MARKMLLWLSIFAFSSSVGRVSCNFNCPEPFGNFKDGSQCDRYWRCEEGVATSFLCPDGLVFNDVKRGNENVDPCDTPYIVNCTDRPNLQEATVPNEYCYRRYGFFVHPDPKICDRFYKCIDANYTLALCTPGLHFSVEHGTCVWPSDANRDGCAEGSVGSLNGFVCPENRIFTQHGLRIMHPAFPHPDKCNKLYVCINGNTPQEASCDLGLVFNEQIMRCDLPENVPHCANFYRDNPILDFVYNDLSIDRNIKFEARAI